MNRVFILGNPRSGTSLLRLMLNSHPMVAAPPESGFLHWWYSKYKDWNSKDANKIEHLEEFTKDILSSRKFETWRISKVALLNHLKQKSPQNYSELGTAIYEHWAYQNNKKPSVIVDKNNYYICHIETLMKIWPDASFIHLVRDGRDVACSYKEMQQLETNSPYKPLLPHKISDIAKEWVNNNKKIKQTLISLPDSKLITIRYEDVLLKTTMELKRIAHFLNVHYDSSMENYYRLNNEPKSTLDWKKKTLEKPDTSNIGKYKAILSAQEIKTFNDYAWKMLNQFGYDC